MSELSAEARVGARWWADKLRKGFFPDNGAPADDATKSPMAVGIIALCHAKDTEGLTAEKIDAFEAALATRIQAEVESPHAGFGFGTDYHPDPILADSLQEAGIKVGMTTLPWKTMMWAKPGSVKVGDGYAAAPVELPLEVEEAR